MYKFIAYFGLLWLTLSGLCTATFAVPAIREILGLPVGSSERGLSMFISVIILAGVLSLLIGFLIWNVGHKGMKK